MNTTFTIETELTGTEAEVYALIDQAVALRKVGDFQASFDLLTQSESLVESVSVSRQGRFFNQRALALKDLKEYDRAILQFDRAAICFESTGETELQGMVHNNIARAYSLLGNYERAHESVDKAISLAAEREHLIQWRDQKAHIYLDQGKPEAAQRELDKAMALLIDENLLEECLATKNRIALMCGCAHKETMVSSASQSPSASSPTRARGDNVPLTPLECVQEIIAQNYEAALSVFTLIAMIADPNGDPDRFSAADDAMQFAFVCTPRGEADCRSYSEEVQHHDQEASREVTQTSELNS